MGSEGSLADGASTFLFLLTAALAGLAARAIPRWLAWPALLLAVLALLPGPFGFLASMVFLAWTATAGITLLVVRQPARISPTPPSLRKRSVMRKPVKLALAAAAAAITIAAGVTAASAAPTATHAASGTEYFQVMSTAIAPGPASVIARGVFTAAGQARLGDAKVSYDHVPRRDDRAEPPAGHGLLAVLPGAAACPSSASRAATASCAAPAGTPGSAATARTS